MEEIIFTVPVSKLMMVVSVLTCAESRQVGNSKFKHAREIIAAPKTIIFLPIYALFSNESLVKPKPKQKVKRPSW